MCGLLLGMVLSASVDSIICLPYLHDLLRLILARGHTSVHFLLLLLLLGMGGACNMYGGEERRIQGFGREARGKETTWKYQG